MNPRGARGNFPGKSSYAYYLIDIHQGCVLPHLSVLSRGVFAQLKHVAKYGNPSGGSASCQNIDGAFHGVGIGIVGIINYRDALSLYLLQSASCQLRLCQSGNSLLKGYTKTLSHCQCQSGICGIVNSGNRQSCLCRLSLILHIEFYSFYAEIVNIGYFEIRFGAASHLQLTVVSGCSLSGEKFIISRVYQGSSIPGSGNVFRYFHLCPEDSFTASQLFHVGNADVGYDPYPWLHNVAKIFDFSKCIHSHFQNRRLGAAVKSEYGQRQPYVIVVVLEISAAAVFLAENIVNHVPCGGFANAAGYCHPGDIQTFKIPLGKSSRCSHSILNENGINAHSHPGKLLHPAFPV